MCQMKILQAFECAVKAHHGQVRKYEDVPYVVHPITVTRTVNKYLYSNTNCIIASLLHDVLEDTDVTEDYLLDNFGIVVTDMVVNLTNKSIGSPLPREDRKAIDREHLAKQDYFVQTIKLADILDNTKPNTKFQESNPDFFELFILEKKKMVSMLGNCDERLKEVVVTQLNSYKF